MNRRLASVMMLVGLLVGLFAGTTGLAAAHAKIKTATPAAGSTVQTAPAAITLVFDNHDPLDAAKSSITVTDASGARVDTGATSLDKNDADRKTLTVALKSGLGNGVYTVAWETASDGGDGSASSGSYTFGVGVAAPLPATGLMDGSATPWLFAVAGLLIAGGLLLQQRARRATR